MEDVAPPRARGLQVGDGEVEELRPPQERDPRAVGRPRGRAVVGRTSGNEPVAGAVGSDHVDSVGAGVRDPLGVGAPGGGRQGVASLDGRDPVSSAAVGPRDVDVVDERALLSVVGEQKSPSVRRRHRAAEAARASRCARGSGAERELRRVARTRRDDGVDVTGARPVARVEDPRRRGGGCGVRRRPDADPDQEERYETEPAHQGSGSSSKGRKATRPGYFLSSAWYE